MLFEFGLLTILKDTLHIQAVGGAGLVVGATLQIAGQFPGTGVVNHARIALADGVYIDIGSNINK